MIASCKLRALATGIAVAALSATGHAEPRVERYAEICDASAAVALDADHFVVADDEHDILVVYRLGRPAPVARIDVVDFLGNRKRSGKVKEADIEGAARIGDRIYWIASHGRDRHADLEPTRHRFFATDIVAGAASPSIAPVGTAYKRLLEDLLAAPQLASLSLAEASAKAPEAPSGLNIEGLAATPDGSLLIGLRNPLPEDKALVIPLLNPSAIVNGGEARAEFGAPERLDLGRRGIRSIERVGAEYIIVAGPYADASREPGGDFALYRWAGPGARPEPIAADLGALRPEVVFAIEGDRLRLLSDDGDETIDGRPCKHKDLAVAKKVFRAMSVPRP